MTLQSILGSNYKWWYLIQYQFKTSSGNFNSFVFNSFIKTIEFLVIIYIWKINSSIPAVITYLAIGKIFSTLYFNEISGQIAYLVWKGSITRLLLIPSNFMLYMICDNLGYNSFRTFINSFVVLILTFVLFYNDILITGGLFSLICFFGISYFLNIFLSFITGSVTFWVNNNSNVHNLIESAKIIIAILSGSLIPLSLINFEPLFYTPISFLIHHPMQIYLGKYDTNQTFLVFAGGITWCIILFILDRIIFKLGLKKYEAVGL